MPTPAEVLKQFWGYDEFRPNQAEIIASVLGGNDTLALLPTGGGKSICFQVPAMVLEGLCLVISPLIALMKDQVEQLKRRGIPALYVHSGLTYFDVKDALQNAAFGGYKFLYVSPERLETALFQEYLPALNINLLAVDEAHCISQWGYDFRPPYLRIADLRTQLPGVPVLALTASATTIVQNDICNKLDFKNQLVFRQSFERANLSYSVFATDSKPNKLLDILKKVPGSAIVYCRNRKRCKQFAQLLVQNNVSADYYHAGLQTDERSRKQEQWIQSKTRVIVCTNAFGMGIDKPDVRVVVHMDIPDNLENYYQEAGRAGRDGKRSFAVLLYEQHELAQLRKMPETRYPPITEIKQIYQSLANYLQVGVGSGEGVYYEFNINEFAKTFKLDLLLVVHALKALAQEDHLAFNEQVFLPSRVGFTCDRSTLEDFEQAHPDNDALIKLLLRTYEGIFDNQVSVNESQVARLLGIDKSTLRTRLQVLQGFGILQFEAQKETPQLFFKQNRAPAAYLTFNEPAYRERKSQYQVRVEAMANYVTLKCECRSRYIGQYFGDTKLQPCKVCDNCLEQRSLTINENEFTTIRNILLTSIPSGGINVGELLGKTSTIKKEKAWKVLYYLQAEKIVEMNGAGLITCKPVTES